MTPFVPGALELVEDIEFVSRSQLPLGISIRVGGKAGDNFTPGFLLTRTLEAQRLLGANCHFGAK